MIGSIILIGAIIIIAIAMWKIVSGFIDGVNERIATSLKNEEEYTFIGDEEDNLLDLEADDDHLPIISDDEEEESEEGFWI